MYIRAVNRLILAALVLSSCAKDTDRLSIQLNASGRMCAIEYPWNGGIGRDTIIGRIDYATGDTLPGTGRWNIVVDDGESVKLRACPLNGDTLPIALYATGDVDRVETTSVPPSCASLQFVARHR